MRVTNGRMRAHHLSGVTLTQHDEEDNGKARHLSHCPSQCARDDGKAWTAQHKPAGCQQSVELPAPTTNGAQWPHLKLKKVTSFMQHKNCAQQQPAVRPINANTATRTAPCAFTRGAQLYRVHGVESVTMRAHTRGVSRYSAPVHNPVVIKGAKRTGYWQLARWQQCGTRSTCRLFGQPPVQEVASLARSAACPTLWVARQNKEPVTA